MCFAISIKGGQYFSCTEFSEEEEGGKTRKEDYGFRSFPSLALDFVKGLVSAMSYGHLLSLKTILAYSEQQQTQLRAGPGSFSQNQNSKVNS